MPPRHRLKKHHRHSPGTAPGTLVAPPDSPAPVLRAICYDKDNIAEYDLEKPEDILPLREKWPRIWINVDGLGDITVLEKLGEVFRLHRLALEDVLNLAHRPKTEVFDDCLFIITRMAAINGSGLDVEQISIFAGTDFVLSFQERAGDCLDPVRERLRNGQGRRIRAHQPDYLAYALIDAIVDGYFPVLEHFSARLDVLEDIVVDHPRQHLIAGIHNARRDLQHLRQSVWPMRDVASGLVADASIISPETQPYLRDCYDHILQILDMLESLRERSSSLIDIYLSSIGNRTNEIMRVLTMIATIFIPLSFIAGVYGMNFDTGSPWNMPELGWYFGYPAVLALMAAVAGGLLLYFRRKGWIGPGRRGGGE